MEPAGDAGALLALMQALEASALGELVRTSRWLYPLASVLHVLGLAFLLGSIAVFDLRVLGFGRGLSLEGCAALLLPIARGAFLLQLASGFLMFAADADHVYDNPYFLLKLALILVALLNILLFHRRLRRDRFFGQGADAPGWARTGAAVSLLTWVGVAVAGRMIAYV